MIGDSYKHSTRKRRILQAAALVLEGRSLYILSSEILNSKRGTVISSLSTARGILALFTTRNSNVNGTKSYKI